MKTFSATYRAQSKPVRTLLAALGCFLLWGVLTLGLRGGLGRITLGADFYIYWDAGRAVVLEGKNPYSPEVVADIQRGILGREAKPGEDQLAFAYPTYALLPTLPFLFMPFEWAQSGWMALQLLIVFFCARLAMRKSPPWMLPALFFFYPLFFGLLLGNFVVFVAAFFLLFFGLTLRKEPPAHSVQILLGFGLAWAACKPQFAWLLLAFALLLSLRLHLRGIFIGFAAGVPTWLLIAFLFYPGWVSAWVDRVLIYPSYTQNIPTLTLILNSFLPAGLSAALTGAVAFACLFLLFRLGRAWWRSKLEPIYLLTFLGVVTFLFHLHSIAYDQLVLYVPFVLWAAHFAVNHRAAALWWLFFFLLSWVAFFVGLNLPAIDTIPVLFFAAWWGWLYQRRQASPQTPAPIQLPD